MTEQTYVHPEPQGHLVRWVSVGVAVVLVGLVGLLAFGGDDDNDSRVVGELVPIVAGATLAGDAYDIDDRRGEYVVVNFFASWCTPCRVEHPELVRWHETHTALGDGSVVGVVFQDDLSDVRAFFDELGGDWPILIEDTASVAVAFGVIAAPETYVVAPDGAVIAAFNGAVSAAELDGVLVAHRGGA